MPLKRIPTDMIEERGTGKKLNVKLDEVTTQLAEKANKKEDKFGYNLKNALFNYRVALSNSKNQLVKVNCLGDSLTRGEYSSDEPNKSWVGQLRNALASDYGNTGEGFINVYESTLPAGANPRWTLPEGWGAIGSGGFGGYFTDSGTSVNPATCSFKGTSFTLLYAKAVGGGTADIKVDGISVGTIDCTGTVSDFTKYLNISGLTDAIHTLTITPLGTGKIFVEGILEGNGATSGIQVNRIGRSGWTASNWLNNNNYQRWAAMPPNLTIISLGMNEANGDGVSVATYKTNVATLIQKFKSYGSSVILHAYFEPSPSWTNNWVNYVNALYELADEYDVGLIDMRKAWMESYSNAQLQGLFGLPANDYSGGSGTNPAHPGDKGYGYIAATMYPYLKSNAGNTDVDNLNVQLSKIVQDTTITVTVGTNGDYPTINDALSFLSKKNLKYSKNGTSATIKLLSGFVMSEQVIVEGLNLGWITITSEDATVSINRSYLTASVIIPAYGLSSDVTAYPAFGGLNNATLPVIGVLFDMDTSGASSNRAAFFVGNGSQVHIKQGKGCTHAGGQGIYCVQGSRANASGANLSYAGANAVSAFRSAYVEIRESNLSYAGAYGVYGDNNSFIDVAGANISNAVNAGIWAASCSYVTAAYATISNCGANGIQADNCSMIDAHSSTINNSGQRGVQCASSSVISATSATITGSGYQGINCEKSGRVDAQGAIVTGSLLKGIWATYGGNINISGGNAQMGASPSSSDIVVASGGIITASGSTGGFSKTANFVDQNGLIISANVVDQNTATLSNGWTGTLYYGKNALGQVWIRGTLTAGTVAKDTLIASIISGYRPSFVTVRELISNSSIVSVFSISTGGGISLRDAYVPAGATVDINITYQT